MNILEGRRYCKELVGRMRVSSFGSITMSMPTYPVCFSLLTCYRKVNLEEVQVAITDWLAGRQSPTVTATTTTGTKGREEGRTTKEGRAYAGWACCACACS
jgi:hypothetical protein